MSHLIGIQSNEIRRFIPVDPILRTFALATLINTFGNGLFLLNRFIDQNKVRTRLDADASEHNQLRSCA